MHSTERGTQGCDTEYLLAHPASPKSGYSYNVIFVSSFLFLDCELSILNNILFTNRIELLTMSDSLPMPGAWNNMWESPVATTQVREVPVATTQRRSGSSPLPPNLAPPPPSRAAPLPMTQVISPRTWDKD